MSEQETLKKLINDFVNGNLEETECPEELFHTADDNEEYGVFIEVYYNDELCHDGCFDLTFCEASRDEDGKIEFHDNFDSVPATLGTLYKIIYAQSTDKIQNILRGELENWKKRYITEPDIER